MAINKDPRAIIIRPIITEHSYDLMERNCYTFEVAKDANKIEIAKAIEKIFDVKVEKVTTMNYDGKRKRMGMARPGKRADWKKAIVKLTEDSKTIELFEEMV